MPFTHPLIFPFFPTKSRRRHTPYAHRPYYLHTLSSPWKTGSFGGGEAGEGKTKVPHEAAAMVLRVVGLCTSSTPLDSGNRTLRGRKGTLFLRGQES
jgi:hypothetical protein